MARDCSIKVKVYFADPKSADGYGTVTGSVPCNRINWNTHPRPKGFELKPTDVYQLVLAVCRGGKCRRLDVDLDKRGGTFRRRKG